MGVCYSTTKEKGTGAQNAGQVAISRSDFITKNEGKFRDCYQLG